jgi:3-deoxy-D-manno-octulosonic-acid transferase
MRFFIDIIFIFFSFFYLVLAIFKRKSLSGLKNRFFPVSLELKRKLQGKNPIWLHAVSVGETISASSFITLFHQRFPKENIIISTITSTGQTVARKIFPADISVIYLPLDLSFLVERAISYIKPKLFILTETEIWPNLILELKKKKVPIALINGRISNKSLWGYRLGGFLFKRIFINIDLFCMKTLDDAKKIMKLGVSQEKVKITGSTKFDLALSYELNEEQKENLRKLLNISKDEKVLVCGSTHEPEEEIIAKVFLELSRKGYNLKLIVAPRHIERVDRIKSLYETLGIDCQPFSFLSKENQASKKVIIVDKIGILRDLYGICSLAFVGGSLAKRGGHNLLEPAGFKKPVLFGKWVYNFELESKLLSRAGGAIMVENEKKLKDILSEILEDEKRLKIMGEAAYSVIEKNSGATIKDLEYVEDLLKTSKIE